MRCCQSQNREHKRDGDSRYGEDHNVVVCKKHGLHYGLQLLRLSARLGGQSPKGASGGRLRPFPKRRARFQTV